MDLERMQALLTALQEARFAGLRSVSYDGKTVDYRSVAEIDQAIEALDREIAAAEGRRIVRQVRVTTTKGVTETVRAVAGALGRPTGTGTSRTHEISVVYDGADLAEVGALTGLGERGVVEAHTGQTWTVAFGGFAPGFPYLVADDPHEASGPPWEVPRRAEPRTSVPAGAVGLASRYCGIYPRPSPGGWQLIGRTDAVLWDIDRSPPALLTPGQWVRFRSVGHP